MPTQPPASAGKAGSKLQAWLRTHKAQAGVGAGAVGAVGIALYRRHKTAAAGSTAGASSTVPADATSAGGIPGSYAPYSGGDGGGGFTGGGDSGTGTGTDAVGLLNAFGNLVSSLPFEQQPSAPDNPTPTSTAPSPTRTTARRPTRTTVVKTIRRNPPGKHNTTVTKIKTVRTTGSVHKQPHPAPKPGHHHR